LIGTQGHPRGVRVFETSVALEPLFWPQGEPPVVRAVPTTALERVFWRVPFIGWELKSRREDGIMRPTVDGINAQLQARPDFAINAPADVLVVATRLSEIIRREMHWENSRYIPNDPIEVLLWPHWDGVDDLAAILKMEAFARCRFLGHIGADYPTFQVIARYPTFGDLVRCVYDARKRTT
jgi:hypothetical protein